MYNILHFSSVVFTCPVDPSIPLKMSQRVPSNRVLPARGSVYPFGLSAPISPTSEIGPLKTGAASSPARWPQPVGSWLPVHSSARAPPLHCLVHPRPECGERDGPALH